MGYRMPAEWEPQSGIWLTWPQNFETFGEFLPKVEKSYGKLIKIVSQAQTVHLLVSDVQSRQRILTFLSNRGISIENLKFHEINAQDVWIRDYGPIFLTSDSESLLYPRLAMVDWIFNAWGNKYEDLKEDNMIPAKINETLHLPCWNPKFVLEGGSIEVNGKGSLMTTEQCL